MKIEYDAEADAAYVRFSDALVSRTEEESDVCILDYDSQDRLVGIELLSALRFAGGTLSTLIGKIPLPIEAAQLLKELYKVICRSESVIDNPKVGFTRYPGYSLLFDNPGEGSLAPMGSCFLRMNAGTQVGFYAKLQDSLNKIGLATLRSDYLFFDLPAYSYHVTVWDGLNEGNRAQVLAYYHPVVEDFLINLPSSLQGSYAFITKPENSSLVRTKRKIKFRFKRLTVWGTVIVALLEPAEEASKQVLETIKQERKTLYQEFEAQFGLKEWNKGYGPHVSLGYFGNKDIGTWVENNCLEDWTKTFQQIIGDEPLEFESISLYGFLDMETFFKKP